MSSSNRLSPIRCFVHIILLLIAILSTGAVSRLHAQHPIGYGSVRSTSQTGTFTFGNTDRQVLQQKTASFYAESPLNLTFEILVAANGDVKYVRAPRMDAGAQELRLACTSALYGHAFNAIDAAEGEEWIKATLVIEKE
jgi:hypothetical protein